MKRSEINRCIKEMEELVRKNGFWLPPFCNFTPEEWKTKGHEYDEIRDNMLGWDITDYGLGHCVMETRIIQNILKCMQKNY